MGGSNGVSAFVCRSVHECVFVCMYVLHNHCKPIHFSVPSPQFGHMLQDSGPSQLRIIKQRSNKIPSQSVLVSLHPPFILSLTLIMYARIGRTAVKKITSFCRSLR